MRALPMRALRTPDAAQPPAERPAPGELLMEARELGVRAGRRELLSRVSMAVHAGEIVTLIGPNGAGKTTLVRALLGVLEPSDGAVWRRPGLRIGYLPQRMYVDPTLPLTVHRFLTLARGAAARSVRTALEEVGAAKLERALLTSLSGGEFQRVLMARALVRNPQLLILDEPVQGVDVGGQLELYDLIAAIRRTHGCGVLLISHDLHLVMSATDRVVCLNVHVCCSGLPESVVHDPAFRELFGAQAAGSLAVYTHAQGHDHRHAHPPEAGPQA
jgi:zinc transport system ATP-binding protein